MNSAESGAAQKTQAEQTITFAVFVAICVAIFVSGSVLEVVGASMTLSFPFYSYFEPADYLRIAPLWGSLLTPTILALIVGESFYHYRGRKTVILTETEWERWKRDSLRQSIFFSACTLITAAFYLGFHSFRLYLGSMMPVICVLLSQYWLHYFSYLPHYPRQLSTVPRALLRIAPQLLSYSLAFGLFTVGPQIKGVATVLVQIKSEPVNEIKGRLAYVLNKYVILKVPKSTVSERSHFTVINAAEILKIEQLPAPSPTPSTSPSITPEKKRS